MFQVLVVCTGNTCRSPMAEGILRSLLPAGIAGQVRVRSAGTGAIEGLPATSLAIQSAAARGIDIRGHRSSELAAGLIRESDLIFVMESMHAARVRELAPDAAERVHLITERGTDAAAEAPAAGVRDPIGGARSDYDDTFNRIRSHLLRWLPSIQEAVERREGVR